MPVPLFEWTVVEQERQAVLVEAISRAWRGGHGVVCTLEVPARGRPRPLLVAWAEGARAARSPRWPDLLGDWSDIHEEPIFPSPEAPVLAEEVSALGADAFVCHAAPGLGQATVGWYEKGALIAYEHVGAATVSFTPDDGLGRPFDGSVAQLLTRGARRLLPDENVLERIEKTNAAVGEHLIARAFLRLLDVDPPPIDELAGLVARAPTQRFRLG
jgi:hypothetical protein